MFLIPLELLYSKEQFLVPLGGHMAPCRKCGQLQPHLVHQVVQRDTGMVIIHQETPLHKLSQCEVCHETIRHRKNHDPIIIEFWEPSCNLRDYAIRSGYDDVDPNHGLITPTSAQALLESVTSKSASSMNLTWKDYLIACFMFILFGIVAIIVFTYQEKTDDSIWALLGIPCAGLFSALFFLVYLQNRHKVKIDHVSDFHNRLNKLGLSPSTVISALPQTVLINQKIYTLVRPFM